MAAPPLKKAKVGPVWECEFGKEWKPFDQADQDMLEERFKALGKKKFTTTEFSFNKGHDTLYEVSFEKMTQTNLSSKRPRNIRRRDEKTVKQVVWEWWNNGEWAEYNKEDGELIEKAFGSGITPFMTKNLSFNKGYDSLYLFDFDVMSQVNSDSCTSRKMQRTSAGGSKSLGHTKGDDDAYADVILGAKEEEKDGAGSAVGAKFDLGLPEKFVAAQKKKGSVSLRGVKKNFGEIVSKDKHGSECFEAMLKNEQEFSGEWVVFYHSYSCAAILYEVQAAVASVLFRFKAEFAGLPRILAHGFKKIPDAETMLKEFPKWKDRDHNPAFKAVGLCATSALLADDSEAPARSVFLAGYSVGSLKGVLEKLLGALGVPKGMVSKVAKDTLALSLKHGLDTGGIPGGKPCKSGRSGHMLQIFLRRELCDKYVYPAFAYGVPDKERDLPLSKYLADQQPIAGQVRITLNPDVFLRATYARMFTYCADPTYNKNRPDFIKELVGLLTPILGDEKVRVKAANGIFGGKPPEWWTPEDQSDLAAMPAGRYTTSSMAE